MNMNRIKITSYVLFALAAIGGGLWGRHAILTEPTPVDFKAFVIYDGGKAYMNIDSGRPFVPKAWFGRRAKRSDLDELLQQALAQPTNHPKGLILRDAFVEEVRFVLSQEHKGDYYRHFNSPENTWGDMCGRKGIALIRDGKAITGVVTELN